jgi:Fibronectin type III domain
MAPQVKPVLGFKTQSDQQIATTASAVIKEMTGNTAFPNPPVELKAVQAAVDELSAAMAAQVQGGTAATAVKKNKRETVITLLRKLAHYVHDNCGNDPAVLLSSGFQLATSSRTRYPVAKPSIVSIDFGQSTELILKVSPIANARCYDVQFAPVGANNAPGEWKHLGLFTNSRSIIVGNLIPGTTYVFQVRAVGGTNGYSDWSDPVAHMST